MRTNVSPFPHHAKLRTQNVRSHLQLEMLEPRRVLATFHVSADVADGEPGSLRAAIIEANQNGEDDTIEMASGDYLLTIRRIDERTTRSDYPTVLNPVGGDLDLTEVGTEVVIRGVSAESTIIDASQIEDRVFDIAAGVNVVLEGITVQGGQNVSGGGGINVGNDLDPFQATDESYGLLTIRDSIVRDNEAEYEGGGINNWGRLEVLRSQFLNNTAGYEGGGIAHNGGGHAAIVDTTFRENRADYQGGAIDAGTHTVGRTSMDISGTTIAENRANYSGGGIESNATTVSVSNSTISNNNARTEGSSINTTGSSFVMDHVTVVNVGGSRSAIGGSVRASNSIFTGHRSNDVGSSFRSRGNNLIGRAPSNLTSDLINVDSMLGPLTDNGGPTPTHMPMLGSPAIDAADSELATDQRGNARLADGDGDGIRVSDIGAVEAPRYYIFHVNSERDEIDMELGNGVVDTGRDDEVTLRGAVMEANAVSAENQNPVLIILPEGEFDLRKGETNENDPDEELAAEDDLDLWGNITIVGAGKNLTYIDAGERSGIFEIHPMANVQLADMTLHRSRWDGAITNQHELALQGVKIQGNRAISGKGGGVTNLGNMTIQESVILRNRTESGGDGGGLLNLGTAEIARTTFHQNAAGSRGNGGAVANFGTATVSETTFSNNSTTGQGGAVYSGTGSVHLINSTVSGNRTDADGIGSGIFFASGDGTIVSATIVHNVSERGAGVVIARDADVRINNSIIALNQAGQLAGTISSGDFNFIGGDPNLGPLADNGGPTETHLPEPASSVIDAGRDFDLTTDQRGERRTVDDPRIPQRQYGSGEVLIEVDDDDEDEFEFELDRIISDGTDIGAVEANHRVTMPEAIPDHFYAFGAFQSDQLSGQNSGVLRNDVWFEPLLAEVVRGPQNGRLVFESNGEFLYVPNEGFRGRDEFQYVAYQFDTELPIVDDGPFEPGNQPEPIHSEPAVVTIDILRPASISGQSYVDRNNDGFFDGADTGLTAVTFHLTGLDQWGNPLSRQVQTNSAGEYRFDDLAPGGYVVRKVQPDRLEAGILSLGNAGGEIRSSTQFSIHLVEGTNASDYRFAERLPERPIPPAVDLIGDVNGDGLFDSSDLVLIFQAGRYEDPDSPQVTFEEGDWNGDGRFDSSDLILAFQQGMYEREVDLLFGG